MMTRRYSDMKFTKTYKYIVGNGIVWYTVMQASQKMWVANCISHNLIEGTHTMNCEQYYAKNGTTLMQDFRTIFKDDLEIYVTPNIIDFRKGVMAVMVGSKPNAFVKATQGLNSMDEEIIKIEVDKK